MSQEEQTSFPDGVRQEVEAALSARFGGRVSVAAADHFKPSFVFRCALEQSGRGAAPETVIVRVPREGLARVGVAGLHRERAALEHLAALGSGLAPRLLAVGAGFLITEDLGAGPSLLDLLLGRDAEAARSGLIAFARHLGTLHAETARRPEILPAALPVVRVPVAVYWEAARHAAALLGLPAPAQVDGDIEALAGLLAEPDCLALSSGDASVVNCKVVGDEVRFFDFEDACVRHPLVDAAVLRFPSPTGAPFWRLPPAVALSFESAYRAARPDLPDDDYYERGLAASCAAWTVLRLMRLPRVDAGPDRDAWPLLPPDWSGPPPARSRRGQLVATLETCRASLRRADAFGALADWFGRLEDLLRERWPEASEPLPLFPAFSAEGALETPPG